VAGKLHSSVRARHSQGAADLSRKTGVSGVQTEETIRTPGVRLLGRVARGAPREQKEQGRRSHDEVMVTNPVERAGCVPRCAKPGLETPQRGSAGPAA
jgi:hypothetical protein